MYPLWSLLETTLHALHDCTYAKELRKSVGHSFITNSFFQQHLLQWLERNILNETRSFLETIGPYFSPWLIALDGIANI